MGNPFFFLLLESLLRYSNSWATVRNQTFVQETGSTVLKSLAVTYSGIKSSCTKRNKIKQ